MAADRTVGTAVAESPTQDALTPAEAPPGETALGEAIIRTLAHGRDVVALNHELDDLEQTYGECVFSELLFLLAHLSFEPPEARKHWQRIVALHRLMSHALELPVDVRVALVSYFLDVSRQLRNPKVIELQLFRQTQESAYRDGLTGLYNFRYFQAHLQRELKRAERRGDPLSLVMLDIDDFKLYNDRNGHHAGNQALAELAQLLVDILRESDVAVRYGGEEFALILPSTTKDGALCLAERVRHRIANHPFLHGAAQPRGRLTVSAGIATWPADAASPDDLVVVTDRALYQAKSAGKNQVHLHDSSRRSHHRFPVIVNGSFCHPGGPTIALTTVNLSEAGMLFLAPAALPLDSLVEAQLQLTRPIRLAARVVRCQQTSDGLHLIAVRVVELADADRCLLRTYLADARHTDPTTLTEPPAAAPPEGRAAPPSPRD